MTPLLAGLNSTLTCTRAFNPRVSICCSLQNQVQTAGAFIEILSSRKKTGMSGEDASHSTPAAMDPSIRSAPYSLK